MALTSKPNTVRGRWDWVALQGGAGVCLILAVPLTLIAAFVDSDRSGTNALFFFGAMTGLVMGAGLFGGLLGSRLQARGFTPSTWESSQ